MQAFTSRLIACLILLGGAQGCFEPARGDGGPRAYPYTAVATVGMVGDVVAAVAGDKAEVTALIGQGVDPHTYKTTTADVKSLQAADVIFYNGLLLEGKMSDTLVKMARSGKSVYAVSERVEDSYLIHPAGASGHSDPHVWMDVQGWMKATEAVREALVEFDPAHAELYRTNAEAYLGELRKLDEYARAAVATIPTPADAQMPVLITAHDAFAYFGRAYGLEVMGIQGISTESEAALSDIQRLVDLIVERDVKAVFVETSVADKYVQSLVDGVGARGKRIRIGGSLFSDAMGQAGTYEGTYIGMIDHNVTTIVRALGGEAPEKGMQGKLSAQ